MGYRLIPWDRPPPPGTPIDWSNPLVGVRGGTRKGGDHWGLTLFVWAGERLDLPRDAVYLQAQNWNHINGTTPDNWRVRETPWGPMLCIDVGDIENNSAQHIRTLQTMGDAADYYATCAYFAGAVQSQVSTSPRRWLNMCNDAGFTLMWDNSSPTQALRFYHRNSGTSANTPDGSVAMGDFVSFGMRAEDRGGGNGDRWVYLNGVEVGSSSAAFNNVANDEDMIVGREVLGNGTGMRGYYSHFGLFSGLPPRYVLEELTRNPWQIFEPQKIFVPKAPVSLITGTGAFTLGAFTLEGAGTVDIDGSAPHPGCGHRHRCG